MSTLNEKALQVLDQLSRNSSISQRELAKSTGISLGLINVILKQFIQDGYLKVAEVNKRKLEYLLTADGAMVVAQKIHHHATSTIQNYRKIRTDITFLLQELYEDGYRHFSIHGDGELKELIEFLFCSVLNCENAVLETERSAKKEAVVLNITAESIRSIFCENIVNVLERI